MDARSRARLVRAAARARRRPARPGLLPALAGRAAGRVARLAAVRVQANAARAVAAGLGRMRAAAAAVALRVRPRHWSAAATMHADNTAIAPASQHAFPTAASTSRACSQRQRVAANVGGGETRRRPAGRPLGPPGARLQLPRDRVRRGVTPLREEGAEPHRRPRQRSVARAYAGPFTDLRATAR